MDNISKELKIYISPFLYYLKYPSHKLYTQHFLDKLSFKFHILTQKIIINNNNNVLYVHCYMQRGMLLIFLIEKLIKHLV